MKVVGLIILLGLLLVDSDPAIFPEMVSTPIMQGETPEIGLGESPREAVGVHRSGPQGSSILIAEVYYHAYRDNEYIVLRNEGQRRVDVGGWSMSDGEGVWELPPLTTMMPGDHILITHNATSLLEDAGLSADLCVRGCVHLVRHRGSFALANDGDGVVLMDALGGLVDAFHYGSSQPDAGWRGGTAPGLNRGEVAKRRDISGRLLDTDTAEDWDWPRVFRLGHSRRAVQSFMDVVARPYISPGQSLPLILSTLENAQRGIGLFGFKLTSQPVARALQSALARGVAVKVGLEGNPPGGMDESQRIILDQLASGGAEVYLMRPNPETSFRRYAYHHAKYAIVDSTWLILGSENFSEDGMAENDQGNRGWGVVAFAPQMAEYLWDVANEDWNVDRSDIEPVLGANRSFDDGRYRLPPRAGLHDFERVSAKLFLSPDNSLAESGTLTTVRSANSTLDVELLYARWNWRGHSNPLVRALLEAAERGVRVRLLLDGSDYNLEGRDDNDELVVRLNRLATGKGIPIEARLYRPGSDGPTKIHNKGLVVDGTEVVVSSMNWNYHGAYLNREAGLHIASSIVAGAFGNAFEEDWLRGYKPDGIAIEGPQGMEVGREGVFIARVQVEAAPLLGLAWDLHADGVLDAVGPSFQFTPQAPGPYTIRLEAKGEDGGREEVEVLVVAHPAWPLPLSPETLIALVCGPAAAALFGWLRIVRERTNKTRKMKTCGGPPPNLGR